MMLLPLVKALSVMLRLVTVMLKLDMPKYLRMIPMLNQALQMRHNESAFPLFGPPALSGDEFLLNFTWMKLAIRLGLQSAMQLPMSSVFCNSRIQAVQVLSNRLFPELFTKPHLPEICSAMLMSLASSCRGKSGSLVIFSVMNLFSTGLIPKMPVSEFCNFDLGAAPQEVVKTVASLAMLDTSCPVFSACISSGDDLLLPREASKAQGHCNW